MPYAIAKTKTGIGNGNTRVWNDNGHFMVQLHQTVIYDETSKIITLNNGGWITPTTARRMNQVLSHRGINNTVSIRKGEMVLNCTRSFTPFQNGKLVLQKQNREVA